MNELWNRLRVLLLHARFDRDLEEEIERHLEMQAEEDFDAGMGTADAHRAARRQFGNATRLKEISREAWGWGPLERVGQDVRYAARVLRNSPVFTAVAVISLVLGIGANTAIFTVVDAALLRVLPVRDPEQLVIVHSSSEGPIKGLWTKNSNSKRDPVTGLRELDVFPLAAAREFRNRLGDAMETFAFFSPGRIGVSDGAGSRPGRVTLVSGNFFTGLAVPMAFGRGLADSDDRPGSTAMVITYSFWQRSLNEETPMLGKVLRLNGAPMSVIGVTAPGFRGISAAGFDGPADIFATLSTVDAIAPTEFGRADRPKSAIDYWWVQIMGRRKPGVSLKAAADRMTAIFSGMLAGSGIAGLEKAKNPRIVLAPGDKGLDTLRASVHRPLLILFGVVSVVLLLACVNVATLQLARSAARRREVAVRLSLGASRGRILRQHLIESLFLSAMGAGAGMLLAMWGAPLVADLLTVGPTFETVWLALAPDPRIVIFTLTATILTGLVFGLVPAWKATRVDIAPNLKHNAQPAARLRGLTAGKLLIAGQAALSLLLISGAGLFLRTLGNLYSQDAGFARDHLLLFRLDLGQLGFKPEESGPMFDSIRQSIATVPGVRSVAAMSHPLVGGWRNSTQLASVETGWQPLEVLMNTVSPGFFETVGMPIVAGRAFSPHDDASKVPLAILNRSAARKLCGNQPAVGQILRRRMADRIVPVEVIGVARDAKFYSLRAASEPTVFVLYDPPYPWPERAFAARTMGDPLAMVGPIRRAISVIDRDVVMMDVKSQDGLIAESLHEERLFATLLSLFACFALLLAAIGLHGVTTYSTARRTGEIGLRVALGATRCQVLALILSQVLRPVCAGMLLGLLANWAATRWIESLLFGVRRLDPLVLAAAFLLLAAVAVAAAFAPAWRAARIDPMAALRSE